MKSFTPLTQMPLAFAPVITLFLTKGRVRSDVNVTSRRLMISIELIQDVFLESYIEIAFLPGGHNHQNITEKWKRALYG